MPELTRIAIFGGIYSNHLALEAALRDVRGRDPRLMQRMYDVGRQGSFGGVTACPAGEHKPGESQESQYFFISHVYQCVA